MFFWKNMADNLTFNIERVSGDLEALDQVKKKFGTTPLKKLRVGARRRQ